MGKVRIVKGKREERKEKVGGTEYRYTDTVIGWGLNLDKQKADRVA